MTTESTPELEVERAPGEHPVTRLGSRLDRLAAFVEKHPWAGFLVILALYLLYLKTHATMRLPWHDELFTYYIAQAPTFGRMIHETRTVDLNPPLSYILTRFVFSILHPSSFSLRLPSMVAFFGAGIGLYAFVARRLSRVYGLLGAVVLLGSFYRSYAFEARPYALELCFLGVAAVGWQMAAEEGGRRRLGLVWLVLGAFAMLLSHVLAMIAYGAFFLAEITRFLTRRKPDWPLWICLIVPLASGYTYLPLFQNHSAGAFPAIFQSSLVKVTTNYAFIWSDLGPLLAAAMIAIVLLGYSRDYGKAASARGRSAGFTRAERVFALYLLLVPLIVALEFMRSYAAYFDRYGMAAIFGVGIVVPWLIAAWTRLSRGAGLVAACILTCGLIPPIAVVGYAQRWLHPVEAVNNPDLTGISSTPLPQVEPNLPLVDASGLAFIEMNARESDAFLKRVYYLTDPQAALKYSHATIFEGFGGLKDIFRLRGNVEPYQEFIRQHPRFLVYGTYDYPEDWLLRKLMADGATVRYLGAFPRGYKDATLYEVTVKQQ